MKPNIPKRSAALAIVALAMFFTSCADHRPSGIESSAKRLESAHGEWPVIPFKYPGIDRALVKTVEYSPGRSADVYWPPDFDFSKKLPVVIFGIGLPEERFLENIGARVTDTGLFVSMCTYIATRGAAAVVMNSHEPLKDFYSCARYLENERELKLDLSRIFLWTRSEHAAFTLLLASVDGAYSSGVKGVCLFTPFLPQLAPVPRPSIPVLIVSAGRDLAVREKERTRYTERLRNNGNPISELRFERGMHAFEIHELGDGGSVETVAESLDFAIAVLLSGS
ncbi:MAG: hypothetical protein E4H20_05985 [Spirochaetales bacterium]|nr:MAG: hypothetical protein E4H20_05985 [Spirochaetales bacterium]